MKAQSTSKGALKGSKTRQATKAAEVIETAQEKAVSRGADHIGSLISWNADKVDAPRDAARSVFALANQEGLIGDLSPTSALTRAIGEGAKPRSMIVRAFEQPSGSPVAFGIYEQRPGQGERGDDFVLGARVKVDPISGVVALPPESSTSIPEALAYAEEIATRANHLVTHCVSRDISAALIELARRLSAMPLRDRGGFYLLPPATCPTWAALTPGLRDLGFRPIAIKMHDCPENVQVAQDAAAGALEADLSELVSDLARASKDGMRADALERRIEICDELTAKAELYLDVLGDLGVKITERLLDLHRSFQEKLDQDADATRRGESVPVSPEVAAKRSEAARKAWATRAAQGWAPGKKAA